MLHLIEREMNHKKYAHIAHIQLVKFKVGQSNKTTIQLKIIFRYEVEIKKKLVLSKLLPSFWEVYNFIKLMSANILFLPILLVFSELSAKVKLYFIVLWYLLGVFIFFRLLPVVEVMIFLFSSKYCYSFNSQCKNNILNFLLYIFFKLKNSCFNSVAYYKFFRQSWSRPESLK